MKFRNVHARQSFVLHAGVLSMICPAGQIIDVADDFHGEASAHPLLEREPFTDRVVTAPFEPQRKAEPDEPGKRKARQG